MSEIKEGGSARFTRNTAVNVVLKKCMYICAWARASVGLCHLTSAVCPTVTLSNGLSLPADVLFSAPQLQPTCFHAVWQCSDILLLCLELVLVVAVVADSCPAHDPVPSLLYIQNTAVALWLNLVLKCLPLGNVKNVEGGGSDLAMPATASHTHTHSVISIIAHNQTNPSWIPPAPDSCR